MKCDDILAELRAFRDDFALAHGYDLSAMGATLRALDAAAGDRVVNRQPRTPVVTGRVEAIAPTQVQITIGQGDHSS